MAGAVSWCSKLYRFISTNAQLPRHCGSKQAQSHNDFQAKGLLNPMAQYVCGSGLGHPGKATGVVLRSCSEGEVCHKKASSWLTLPNWVKGHCKLCSLAWAKCLESLKHISG